jgi:PTS system mannose-specific IIA component
MTEIVVITHGNLAAEMVKVVSGITDRPAMAIPVCLEFHRDQAEYTSLIADVLNRLDPNGQIIILTDLFGGTPSNITFPFVKEGKVEVITGMNLPILMYLEMNAEEKSFQELCEGASKAGKEAIIIAGQFMS